MAEVERKQSVQDILKDMRGLDGLKRLFWQELNYERENKPLSTRQWPESAKGVLAEDPVLFASGGEDNAFHVVYCRLASAELKRGCQRPIVDYLLRDHPYALFIFSNKVQTAWHFLNVKYDAKAENRRLFRRLAVRPGEGLRTAAERLQMLDLKLIGKETFGIPALEIQHRHDAAFDVEKVTKEFYKELANWYFWALKSVRFPKDAPKEADGHDHISIIRLITRLIFCWFIKEKGLIPEMLFDQRRLEELLDGFAPDKAKDIGSVFYRAILQNLFFATLNTEMKQRGWRRDDQNFMSHNLYRHKGCFRDPRSALEWFKNIPFLNGGLFECLDKDLGEGSKPRYVRIDGYSDRTDSQPTVPDFLFFGPEREVDLSEDYHDKKFSKVRVRGLIDTLNRYKFTIEENTPFDQEVALDPELCGKVFENLLAAYNPETGTTARKATGSFYTPREIVDYMVDEALLVYLSGKSDRPNKADARLRMLLGYGEDPHGFNDAETETLIDAIDRLKALDPAVGSGAFPMGILHKLVLVLGKLDPDNERWKAKQIAKLDDAMMREEAERVFRDNYDNYGRKLYLIENCIYGVDIQPIAVQIAKMRFFISLIVDQKINPDAPNLGVRALPNLETKFVAANTLIGIERPEAQGKLFANPKVDRLKADLALIRHRMFTAKTTGTKNDLRKKDAALRLALAEEVEKTFRKANEDETRRSEEALVNATKELEEQRAKPVEWQITRMTNLFGEVEETRVDLTQETRCRLRDSVKNLEARLRQATQLEEELDGTATQLAAWDPYDQNEASPFFDPEWMFGVRDGFDVVIGNPPYIPIEGIAPEDRKRFQKRFPELQRKYDSAAVFILACLEFLTNTGNLTFISSVTWQTGENYNALRHRLLTTAGVHTLVNLPFDVFETAYVDTGVYILCRRSSVSYRICLLGKKSGLDELSHPIYVSVKIDHIRPPRYKLILNPVAIPMLSRLCDRKDIVTLGSLTDSTQGLASSFYSQSCDAASRFHFPFAPEAQLRRYCLDLKKTAYADMSDHQSLVRFYEARPKILIRRIINRKDRIEAAFTSSLFVFKKDINPFIVTSNQCDVLYLLALVNSRFISWLYVNSSSIATKDDFRQTTLSELRELPIPIAPATVQEEMARMVTRILAVKDSDPAEDTSALEREIDERVYRLYGLTEDEIRIVEGASREVAQDKEGGK
jgi:hypothetical protein